VVVTDESMGASQLLGACARGAPQFTPMHAGTSCEDGRRHTGGFTWSSGRCNRCGFVSCRALRALMTTTMP